MVGRSWRPHTSFLVILFILGSATVAGAQPSASLAVDPDVHASIQRDGVARVIVELRTPLGPHVAEGALTVPSAIAAQRQAIAAARAPVLAGLASSGHRVVRQFTSVPFIALEIGDDALRALEASSFGVGRVIEDTLAVPQLNVSGPLVGADQVWARGFDGTGTTVAVLDTGVETAHPFLTGRVVEEACFASGNNCPNGQSTQIGPGAAAPCSVDNCIHGTHVAGIAAGDGATAGTSFSGIAPGATIIAVQVFVPWGGEPGTFTSDQMAALEYVYELRDQYQIASVNMSLGSLNKHTTACDSDPRKPIIDNLRAAGIAVAVAAANQGYVDGMGAPACISSAVSVAASDMDDVIASFTNISPLTSVVAPGVLIQSSLSAGYFGPKSGTSMAAPHVAGAFAVLRQAAPAASVTEILSALEETGVLVTDTRQGGTATRPRIELAAALDQLIGAETTPPTVALTAPTNGANVSGTVLVSATAADNAHVVSVQFLLDGVALGAADTTAPYAIGWDTATATPGSHTLTAVATDASGNTTTSAPIVVTVAGASSSQPVAWVSPVKVTVNGSSVTKTSGCEGCADAGAASQQTIASGDGFVEFTVSPNESLTVGLSNGNPGTSGSEIKFALRFGSTYVEVRESGVYKAEFTQVTGAVYKIAVEGGVVKYYQNGALKYTSTVAPTYPVLLDISLWTLGAAVQNAVITTGSGGGTPSPPPDTTPPSVTITAPTSGGTLTGTVTVTATASDNVGVVGVQFKVDGVDLGAEDTTAPYSVSWDTMTAGAHWHTLTAVARDAAGNTTTSDEVHVFTGGASLEAWLIGPFGGSTLSGTVTVSMLIKHAQGPTRLILELDGGTILMDQTVTDSRASYAWNTTGVADGTHALKLTARDAAGRARVTGNGFTVANAANTAPTVTMTAPADGATVSGTVALSATASDNVGVKSVMFVVDGFSIGEDASAPYGVTWNTATLAAGQYVLYAVAWDADGTTRTSSAPITVFVGTAPPPLAASFTSPADGSTVNGTVSVDMQASGAQGTPISFTLTLDDTTTLFTQSGAGSTASYGWNTLGVSNGPHTLKLAVQDGGGRTSTASLSVTVSNGDPSPPTVTITAPTNGATVSGTVTVSADASDNAGVAKVDFKLNGIDLASDTTAPYAIQWDTTKHGNATFTVTAMATDTSGNTTTSAPVTVTVSNGGPPPPPDPEPVVWTSAVNVDVSGNTITKNAGCNGCADAGAISQQTIPSGSGSVSFTVGTGSQMTVGLGTGNTGTGGADIEFGLRFYPGSTSFVEVRESGVYKWDFQHVAGATYKIAVEAGVVKYYQNGTLKYTSTGSPTYPLLVDTSLNAIGSVVQNAVIGP